MFFISRREVYQVSEPLKPYIRRVTEGKDMDELLLKDDDPLEAIMATASGLLEEETRQRPFALLPWTALRNPCSNFGLRVEPVVDTISQYSGD